MVMKAANCWQYNGAAPMDDIIDWSNQHIPGEFLYNGFEVIAFLTTRSQVMFLLKWA
jgi:hypothetical protein